MVQLYRQGPGRVQQTLAGRGGLARVGSKESMTGEDLGTVLEAKIRQKQTHVMHTHTHTPATKVSRAKNKKKETIWRRWV